MPIPGLQVFAMRPDGTMTALIAIDDLPELFKIDGVPVTLTPDQTLGLKCIGLLQKISEKFTLRCLAPHKDIQTDHSVSDATLEAKTGVSVQRPSVPSVQRPSVPSVHRPSVVVDDQPKAHISKASAVNPIEHWRQEVEPEESPSEFIPRRKTKKTHVAPSTVSTEDHAPYAPQTPGVLGKKVYCTHWLRTGECDFTQQGCQFKHVMPDWETMELLGFREYPRWWREQQHPNTTGLGFPPVVVQPSFGFGRGRGRLPFRSIKAAPSGFGSGAPLDRPVQSTWISTPQPSRAPSTVDFYDAASHLESQLESLQGRQEDFDHANHSRLQPSRITEVSDESSARETAIPAKVQTSQVIAKLGVGSPVQIMRRPISQYPSLTPSPPKLQEKTEAKMQIEPQSVVATGPRPLDYGIPQLPEPHVPRRFEAPDAHLKASSAPADVVKPANQLFRFQPKIVQRGSAFEHSQFTTPRGGKVKHVNDRVYNNSWRGNGHGKSADSGYATEPEDRKGGDAKSQSDLMDMRSNV